MLVQSLNVIENLVAKTSKICNVALIFQYFENNKFIRILKNRRENSERVIESCYKNMSKIQNFWLIF